MSRRTAILPAALLAVLLGTTACKKSKPTAPDKQPPPPDGVLANNSGTPGGPNAGQPADPSLPTPPQAPGLSNPLARQQSRNNLQQIGLGLHNAADVHRTIPIGIADKSGKVGLSWRVAILPYIEQDNLYKQFKLDEPWDSEHNKKLIEKMPKVFAPPGTDTNGYTYCRSFSGPDTVMPPLSRRANPGEVVGSVGLFGITDGTANTFLVVEAAQPVIWTKPDELPFDKAKPPPKVGGSVFRDGFTVAMCDGSARFIRGTMNPTDLANAINRQDGMIVNWPD